VDGSEEVLKRTNAKRRFAQVGAEALGTRRGGKGSFPKLEVGENEMKRQLFDLSGRLKYAAATPRQNEQKNISYVWVIGKTLTTPLN